MSTQKQYELVYIVAPEATEEQLAALNGEVQQVVSRFQGTIDRTDNWGRRKLAYPIGKYKEGIYVLHVITGPGDLVKELDRRLKVTDNVIRHLIVRVDEALRIAERRKDDAQGRDRTAPCGARPACRTDARGADASRGGWRSWRRPERRGGGVIHHG